MLTFFIFIMDGPKKQSPCFTFCLGITDLHLRLQHVPSLGKCHKGHHLAHCSLKNVFLALSRDQPMPPQIKVINVAH